MIRTVAVAAVLALRAVLPPLGAAAAEPDEIILDFQVAAWDAAAYAHRTGGPVGWLRGPDGSLRVELGSGGPGSGPEVLLDRTGEGWTLILGPDDRGTLNAWGREWRAVDPGLARLAREAVAFLDGPADGDLRRRVVIPELGAGRPAAPDTGPLRRELVRRGRGRGGRGEIILLERPAPTDPAGAFEVRSTRRPGRIRVGRPSASPRVCPVPEVFLPLWPLGEITRPASRKSSSPEGTSSAAGG